MSEKTPEMKVALQGLSIQMQLAQDLIIAMQEKHGNDETIRMINEMLPELSVEQAGLLKALVTAMQAEAMGDAGKNIH